MMPWPEQTAGKESNDLVFSHSSSNLSDAKGQVAVGNGQNGGTAEAPGAVYASKTTKSTKHIKSMLRSYLNGGAIAAYLNNGAKEASLPVQMDAPLYQSCTASMTSPRYVPSGRQASPRLADQRGGRPVEGSVPGGRRRGTGSPVHTGMSDLSGM